MDVGSVLSEAWELYRRFFVQLVGAAAIVFAVLGLVGALTAEAAGDGVLAGLLWGVIGLAVSLVGYFWLQGALVEAVQDVRDGRADLTIGELFRRARPRLPALIAAGVIAGVAVGIGFILLIVPGLFLLTRWLLIAPVIVLEGRSAGESFSRSWELVRGHSWGVFGVIVVTVLLVLVASFVVGVLLAALLAVLPDFFASWIGNTVINSLIAPFIALAWTLVYYRLARETGEVSAVVA
jgi:Membrane domain of glycerophosphoryl diester phosphodiesterase/Uncharacterised protein family (UPF0259)